MDREIIHTVLTVAALRSFSAAAYTIPCAQSSVSRRVEAAERELGVELFVRPKNGKTNTVLLTPAGEQLLPVMERIMDEYSELFGCAEAFRSGGFSPLELGVRRNMMAPMAVSMMNAEFYTCYPAIHMSIKQDDFEELLTDLRIRRVDAILFSCGRLDPAELSLMEGEQITYLGSSNMSVGIHAGSELSRLEEAELSQLKGERFLLNDGPSETVPGVTFSNPRRFYRACQENGFTPKVRVLPSDMLDVRYKLAMDGDGVFPSHTPRAWRFMQNLHYISIRNSNLKVSYYLIHRQGRIRKNLETFAKFFAAHLDENAFGGEVRDK